MKEKIKQSNLLFIGLLSAMTLTGCKNGISILEENHTTYVMEDGQKLEVGKIELDDGREYYLAAIDSVNYQQAVNLQKDGWVLPRMHGMYSQDEHRYSSNWIKMEEIIGDSLCDTNEDLTAEDMQFRIKGHKCRLLGRGSHLRKNKTIKDYWTDTRYLNTDGYYAYVFHYDQSVEDKTVDLYNTYYYFYKSEYLQWCYSAERCLSCGK